MKKDRSAVSLVRVLGTVKVWVLSVEERRQWNELVAE